MAAKDGSKRLHVVKSPATSRRYDEAIERLDVTHPVAYAIADALKVLTALERTTPHAEPIGMPSGLGAAAGYSVTDDTMPDLAAHLCQLIDQMDEASQTIREEYESLTKPRAEAANGHA